MKTGYCGGERVYIVSHILIIDYCLIESESDINNAFQCIFVSVSIKQAAL